MIRDFYPEFKALAVAPPLGPDGKMHVIAGLRWCIAVADQGSPEVTTAARLLYETLHGVPDYKATTSLFDDFRKRWANFEFECQQMVDDFDFRDMIGSAR